MSLNFFFLTFSIFQVYLKLLYRGATEVPDKKPYNYTLEQLEAGVDGIVQVAQISDPEKFDELITIGEEPLANRRRRRRRRALASKIMM